MIGGSIMPHEVTQAMLEASRHFVSLEELHLAVGSRIAALTRNEAAVVTSGAAAGLAVSVAACMTLNDPSRAIDLPRTDGLKREVLIFGNQRNGFLKAVDLTGAQIIEWNEQGPDAAQKLEEAINEQTACVLYFDTSNYTIKDLSLEQIIQICKAQGVPIIVDAAAQLPPVENLWRYTEMGADMVIFSGGKTLRGPQSSGFIVGKQACIEACRLFVGARESIGRPMKVGKEELAGLLAAVERYIGLDHALAKEAHERLVQIICDQLADAGIPATLTYPGPTGQDYSLVKIDCSGLSLRSDEIAEKLLSGSPSILIASPPGPNSFSINPLHIQEQEAVIIVDRLKAIMLQDRT
jgi:L-seryl-tRNA(Ser) seleniumtransferase